MVLHIDLNSCFATIEQQANPLLRGKPVAVAAYTTPNACIIAPSIEAKQHGITVGMRIREGKKLYPKLTILPPDPWKYRFVNRKILALLQQYCARLTVKSIDEVVLHLENTKYDKNDMLQVAKTIKKRIRQEIGAYLTVSIGIAPNRYLAKVASQLHKPDGLTKIDIDNFLKIYKNLKVENLCGIKFNNMVRLNRVGIFTVDDMYQAPIQKLKAAFCSVVSYYWYYRLRGYEIDEVDFQRKSFGHSYALYKATNDITELSRLLCKLVEKMGKRLRNFFYTARGIHLALEYTDYSFWHHGQALKKRLYASFDLYAEAKLLLLSAPRDKKVRNIAVSCFDLEKNSLSQLCLFEDEKKKRSLTSSLDEINNRFGAFSIFPAAMIGLKDRVPDRVAFGAVQELEEFIFAEKIESEKIIPDYCTSSVYSSVQ